jgi:hypothetical protein
MARRRVIAAVAALAITFVVPSSHAGARPSDVETAYGC